MKATLVTLASLAMFSIGAAQDTPTVDPGERAATFVRLVATFRAGAVDSAGSMVRAVIVRDDNRIDLDHVTGARADGRMLIFEYQPKAAGGTMRAVCDAADVVMVLEQPEAETR
ncbi:hypothetical protein [Haloferula sargassicola]|uniref:Uncharacterized protein n=1 Tax=Haloferula sargassicola TaxID=490096 RepID=A0ABP9UT20_9BACT